MRLPLAALVTWLAGSAHALTPLPPCGGVESGMQTGPVAWAEGTGLVFEGYSVIYDYGSDHHAAPQLIAPEGLDGFSGSRVTHCASGRMVAIAAEADSYKLAEVLGATEFLRKAVQGKRRATAGQMTQAAKAVYGKVLELRDNEETCACNTYFPELRPKGMIPFADRSTEAQ
ncbi:hypothetical protein HOY34_08550 [Xinfangfangia sp. D13-10-4-6]|uniref:hypothetical protein n=1 Tax=Pseudogemmobacter hezensis TaxID=2737662 RepID=UPI001557BF7E|nr:hypothetical protein [Pseudogemmobacter hezensis]NPD15247.1 hypothetical protein [Pseudogemmobacter hezensis]